jgi:hypothetical protein
MILHCVFPRAPIFWKIGARRGFGNLYHVLIFNEYHCGKFDYMGFKRNITGISLLFLVFGLIISCTYITPADCGNFPPGRLSGVQK